MSEQGRSYESSPLNWEVSSNGGFTLSAELLDELVPPGASSEGREEGREDLSLDGFKAVAAAMPSDADEEPSGKRPYVALETTSTSSKPPTKRKKKPKGLPKRALSGYNCFFSSERLKIQQEMPGIDFEELGRVVGRRWNELSEEERQPYHLLAQEDSVRYHNEMEAFKKRKEEEQKATSKKNEKEEADHSQSLKKEPSSNPSPTSTHARARSPPDNFQSTQVPTDSSFSVPPSQAGGSRLFWSIQQPTHRSGHPTVPFQSSMGPSPFQTSAFQPPPNANCFFSGCFPVPPGLEIFLPDAGGRERKYTVQYTWQSMTRESAEQFMVSLMQPPRNMPPQFQGFNPQYMPPPQETSSRNRGPLRHPPSMVQYQAPPPPPRSFHRY